jgi:DNA-binding CsgD family transcriptional regulator
MPPYVVAYLGRFPEATVALEDAMTGRMVITERDLSMMLGIVGHPDDADVADPMPYSILAGLHHLIACDNVTFARVDSQRQEVDFEQEVGDPGLTDAQREAWNAAFWTHYWHSPPCSYPDTSGDLTTVTAISDFHSDRQFHATAMYRECFRLEGVERMLTLCLPSQPGRVPRLLFFRGAGSDFSPRDRGLLTLLRPHLDQAFRAQARRRRPVPELTARQWQLLRFVAAGYTNGQIGRRMSITEATVRKHLEHVFGRLQVTSRTAAVTRAFGGEQL